MPSCFADFVNVRDVRMIQRRRGLCFLRKAAHAVLIRGEFSRQNFQRDFARACVLRQIHFAHSAFAELRVNLVMTEFCAGFKRHQTFLPAILGFIALVRV